MHYSILIYIYIFIYIFFSPYHPPTKKKKHPNSYLQRIHVTSTGLSEKRHWGWARGSGGPCSPLPVRPGSTEVTWHSAAQGRRFLGTPSAIATTLVFPEPWRHTARGAALSGTSLTSDMRCEIALLSPCSRMPSVSAPFSFLRLCRRLGKPRGPTRVRCRQDNTF